ncbi:secreted RxLR effector protein 161-like [Humulus lupulus]|uniref:secreted RxLR effector protein 161-like n=1 Tax=Humulus lupulus TaxID=3486 RepID=UPI002B401697|nr:secreted RxLR effector protein 161-like [Humulus lupulus]
MDKAKSGSTPLAPNLKLTKEQAPKTEQERNYMDMVSYASGVGSLIYVRGTRSVGLTYSNKFKTHNEVLGYVDSDYAGCIDTRRSLMGYVFTIQGGCVRWKENLQKVVALSSTEAEYMAATEAIKEAIDNSTK